MFGELLLFGGHVFELAGGHYLAEKLDETIRSRFPRKNHDLEHAVAEAFVEATKELLKCARTPEYANACEALRELPVDRKMTLAQTSLQPLMFGDLGELATVVGGFIAPLTMSNTPDIQSGMRRDLTVGLMYQFGEVLKEEQYQRAWIAFERDMARTIRADVKELVDLSQEQRGDLRRVVEHLDRVEGGDIRVAEVSARFQSIARGMAGILETVQATHDVVLEAMELLRSKRALEIAIEELDQSRSEERMAREGLEASVEGLAAANAKLAAESEIATERLRWAEAAKESAETELATARHLFTEKLTGRLFMGRQRVSVQSVLDRGVKLAADGHPEAASELIDTAEAANRDELVRILSARGDVDLVTGDLEGAARWFQKVVEAKPSDPQGLLTLARVIRMKGELDSDEKAHEKGLREATALYREVIRQRASGASEADPILEDAYQELGDVLESSMQFEETAVVRMKQLELIGHQYGTNSVMYLNAIQRVVRSLIETGDWRGAEPFALEAVERSRRMGHGAERGLASALGNLASIYEALGDVPKAITLAEDALAVLRAVMVEVEEIFLITGNNLAGFYMKVSRNDDAITVLREVVPMAKEAFGRAHQLHIVGLSLLGAAMSKNGLAEALEPLDEAFELAKEFLGGAHPITLMCMNELADYLWRADRDDEALGLAQHVVIGRTKLLGAKHPFTLLAMSNLTRIYKSLRQFEEACEMGGQAWTGRMEVLGPGHPYTIYSTLELGEIHLAMGDEGEAKRFLELALMGYSTMVGPDCPEAVKIRSLLDGSEVPNLGKGNVGDD